MPARYHVRITDRASADLQAIFDYIRVDSPQNAGGMVERILDAIDDLEIMPGRFRRAGLSRSRGSVHARVVRPYIIYYRVDEEWEAVFILTIHHGARQQPCGFDWGLSEKSITSSRPDSIRHML